MKAISSTGIKLPGITILCLASVSSWASIIITGTRVIYPSAEKEVTVKLNNVGVYPVLVQSWIDNGDVNAKPENISVPFILTPPINRVEQGQTEGQMIAPFSSLDFLLSRLSAMTAPTAS